MEWRFSSDLRNSNAKGHVAVLGDRQHGRVRYDQLRALGIGKATIRRWVETGYLHPVLPRVYAVGHRARAIEADLSAALLYAGPGAMLSHGTAIWWLGLLHYPPHELHVSTPRRVKSLDGIVVHGRRSVERVVHNGFPVTTVSQALLDFSAVASHHLLRLALANADFRGALDVAELSRTGSAAVRDALDAIWADAKVIVEIDGWRGHRSRAQLERDHQRDLELRRLGYTVLRYTWRQLREIPRAVADEISSYL